MQTDRTPVLGQWDFHGSCAPDQSGKKPWAGMETFSLGIFRWAANAKGGLKRGKIVRRVHGRTENAAEVFAEARRICDEMNAADRSNENVK